MTAFVQKRLVSTKEIRTRLGGCGNTHLHTLFNQGLLPRIKMGTRTYTTEEALCELIDSLPRVTPTPPSDHRGAGDPEVHLRPIASGRRGGRPTARGLAAAVAAENTAQN